MHLFQMLRNTPKKLPDPLLSQMQFDVLFKSVNTTGREAPKPLTAEARASYAFQASAAKSAKEVSKLSKPF